ncbi:MAG TPA: CcmD family protein [Thermomicrobiaceae bacterium]|nr:CcmD family protein [Thermomicrobiaceae bacterium]
MDRNLVYLFVGFLVTWLIMGVYLVTLGRQIVNLRGEVAALEEAERQFGSGLPSEPEVEVRTRQE